MWPTYYICNAEAELADGRVCWQLLFLPQQQEARGWNVKGDRQLSHYIT